MSEARTIPTRAFPNSKAEKHLAICRELNDMYKAKNNDYGDSFGEQFKEYGEMSAVWRLEDKLRRLKYLAKNPAQVTDEKKEDTIRDLSNYAIMYLIELGEKDGH